MIDDDTHIRDHCGVFGITNHKDSAELTRLGLYSLQHRGQESAGIIIQEFNSKSKILE